MWYLKACRSCLTTNGILIRINAQAKQMFCAITGLQLAEDDGFPQYFCAECMVQIKKAVLFRRRSRRAHFVLKEIDIVKKKVFQADVETIDRSKTNLLSPYSFCTPGNVVAYSYTTADAVEVQPKEELIPEIQEAIKASLIVKNEPEFNINCDKENKTIEIEVKSYQPKHNQARTYLNKHKENKINQTQADCPIKDEITDETPVINELIKQELKTLNSTSILVDIRPENWTELDREEEERKKRERQIEIEAALKEIDDEQYDDGIPDCNEVPEDIDMEDIFKGLKEEKVSDGEEDWRWEPGPVKKVAPILKLAPKPKVAPKAKKPEPVVVEGVKRTKYNILVNSHSKKTLINVFSTVEIKLLGLQEQKEKFAMGLLEEPFKSSLHKCSVCVCTFNYLDELYKHVTFHNNKVGYRHVCNVCKDRFRTEEEMNQHGAFCHWYEYSCGMCKKKHYTMESLLKCYSQQHLGIRWPDIAIHFKIRPLKQEAMADTVSEWTGSKTRYACEKCKIYFTSMKAYSAHMATHEMFSKHTCSICTRNYISLTRLESHMIHWHLYSYTCKKCKMQYKNHLQAREHLSREHSMCCRICNHQFEKKKEFEAHINRAHRTACNMCAHSATDDAKLKLHQVVAHGYIRLGTESELNDIRWYCVSCGIYFMSEKVLYKHLVEENHDAVSNYENGCVGCGILFDSAEEYQEHKDNCPNIFNKSSEEQKQQCQKSEGNTRLCETCGKEFHYTYLKTHLKTHDTQIGAGVPCRYCGLNQSTPAQHVSHIVFNHTNKPYLCTVCELRFPTRTSCRDHILKTHAPVKPYSCEACKREFAHLDFLHDHCKKAHNFDLKKNDKSVFLSKRMFGKVYTYPHMKIDGSLIYLQILEKAPIEICDYMDENNKLIDYTEVFFFDPTVDPTQPTLELPKKIRKKQTKEQYKRLYEKKKETRLKRRREKRLQMKNQNSEINDSIKESNQFDSIQDNSTDKNLKIDENIKFEDDEQFSNVEALEENENMDVETEDVLGQLIEKDGEYYVLVNDVLYALEDDCVAKLKEQ